MNQHKRLREVLKPHLGWHGARLEFISMFLLALIRVRTVNLSEIALGFQGSALPASNVKRLYRFFRWFEVDYTAIAKTVVTLMQIPQPWVLSIDRTEWEFGSHRYNILTLGIIHEGVAFPVLWAMLDKQGNSNTEERVGFLEKFYKIFPNAQVAFIAADREFLGKAWVRYLRLEPSIPFRIRIRETDLIERAGRALQAKVVFAHLQRQGSQLLCGQCRVWGQPVFVGALRLADGELLVVIGSESPETLISDYAQRWGIETLFGILKTRGFCLESTHLTDAKRLSKLLALLALALCWAMQTGLWLHRAHPLVLKNHGRRAKSLFRYGLDHLRHILLNPDAKNDEFLQALQLLSCT